MKRSVLWCVTVIAMLAVGNIAAKDAAEPVVVSSEKVEMLEKDLGFLRNKVNDAEEALLAYRREYGILGNIDALVKAEAAYIEHLMIEQYRIDKEFAQVSASLTPADRKVKAANTEHQRDVIMNAERRLSSGRPTTTAMLRRLQATLARYEKTYEEVAQEHHDALMLELLQSRKKTAD